MKYDLETTPQFDKWLRKIRDKSVLRGGDKSTQSNNISKAKTLLAQLE